LLFVNFTRENTTSIICKFYPIIRTFLKIPSESQYWSVLHEESGERVLAQLVGKCDAKI